MSHKLQIPQWESSKLLPHHIERLAIVYVRQSTLQQVLDHQESTRLQYGLVERAKALGWSSDRIVVIDDDLGKSGATTNGRVGFQRLVSEVGLGHVGLVLGIEMFRLARSSTDWYHLLEICALFRTLIGDNEGIYDPNQFNDRLLLGLKGTMSEAELHLIRQRLGQGKLNKARRGELRFPLPTGYIRQRSGEVSFDPDEQVQQVIHLIFHKFEQLGTLNRVLCYLVEQQIEIGVRSQSGTSKGELEWHRPNRVTLQNILKSPIYAGAYVYGRKQVDPCKQQAGRSYCERVVNDPNDWHVLLKDRFPAYISWEQYQRNLAQLQANRTCAGEIGASRHGASLLVGLLVCGKCGCRMTVHYHHQYHHRYVCCRQAVDYGQARCQSLAGPSLDEFVTQQMLHALQPAALELSLSAASHLEQERTELNQLWQQRLERATFEADRARRHYQLVEPENRLVARQLAQEWELKLRSRQQLQEDYDRFCQTQPQLLSEAERNTIRQLAHDLPALWQASTTTNSQRKDMLRQVISRVIVDVEGESEWVQVTLEWIGGANGKFKIQRPVATFEQLSNYDQLCQRLREFVEQGLSAPKIAEQLNQEGFYPPKRRTTFRAQQVQKLIRELSLIPTRQNRVEREELAEHEWWLSELAQHLDMSTVTLYSWIRRGWVQARQDGTPFHHWIIWADSAELERLKQRCQQPRGYATRERWLERRKSMLVDRIEANLEID